MQGFCQTDLSALAGQQFITAHLHCGHCLAFHALWPYLRLGHVVGGVEADQAHLTPVLSDLLSRPARRVLIAGSADTGVTALVHHAAGATAGSHHITVVDHCATPLVACGQYAIEHRLSLRTRRCDLRSLDVGEAVDLIVGHSILPHLSADGRRAALGRLFDALAPGGQMVLTTRLSAPGQSRSSRSQGSVNAAPDRAANWSASIKVPLLASLKRQGIALPCPAETFDALVQSYAQLPSHNAPYAEQAELQAELEAAGLRVERWIHAGLGNAFLDNGQVQLNARQGLVAVTAPK